MAFELTGLWSVRTCYVAFYYESMSIEYRENLKAGTNPYSWPYWTRGCNLRGGGFQGVSPCTFYLHLCILLLAVILVHAHFASVEVLIKHYLLTYLLMP